MSATINASLFQGYFKNCPLVDIESRNFDVEIRWAMERGATFDVRRLAYNTAMHINDSQPEGNILIFLPGEGEIKLVCRLLKKNAPHLEVFPLFSRLPQREQHMALSASKKRRKCIVATNIAETSLTIDGVVYVIDCGLSRQMIYNPRLDMEMLDTRPISQASARQRTGRAGRTRPGVCYRLYSRADFDRMPKSTEPAMRCRPVHEPVLKVMAMGYKRPVDFDWIDAPCPDSIARADQNLQDWYVP